MKHLQYTILQSDPHSSARTGIVKTAHGDIATPIFMPVGTAATVKAISQDILVEKLHAPIILANTYHLFLRPGMEIIQAAGGAHEFMTWPHAMLTDSGGYQVFSLAQMRKIKEEGVHFRAHTDGRKVFLSPEIVMDIQRQIGADIIMAFDECTPYPCEYAYAKQSMELTHRWLDRCVKHLEGQAPLYGHFQSLFPIVQGSTYKDLRIQSAEYIASKNCAGNAIGGLSVGEPAEDMYEMTAQVCQILPKDKPRYLMGVGTPANILECIALGVDMFDCVMPTRNARNGMLFTTQGIINIRNQKWENDFSLIDPLLVNGFSDRYSKAYLRHLMRSNEILGAQIASVHNIALYLWLVNEARTHIAQGDFVPWKDQMVKILMQRL